MKKLPIISLIFLLVLSFSVLAAGIVKIESVASDQINLDPGLQANVVVNVSNIGDATIGTVTVSSSDIVNGNNRITISQQPQSITNLQINANNTKTTSFVVVVPNNVASGDYSATVTARDSSDSNNVNTLTYSIHVNNKVSFDVNSTNQANKLSSIELTAGPGDQLIKTFTLKNSGNVDLTSLNLFFDSAIVKDVDDNEARFTVSPQTVNNLRVGESVEITVTTDTDAGYEIKKIPTALKASAQGYSSLSVIPLNLDVKPNSCNPSASTSGIKVSITTPSDNDDVGVDEKLTVKIDVDNNANNNKRIRTALVLYNLDKNRRLFSQTQEKRIESDSTEEFDYDIDLSQYNIKDDDQIGIYAKSFERGHEDDRCDDDQSEIRAIVPAHSISLESVTLNPITANCGDSVSVLGTIRNSGSNTERITLNVKNTNLGVSTYSQTYNLGTSSDNNNQLFNSNFEVPRNTAAGNYVIDVLGLYGSTTVTSQKTLTVTCGAVQQTQSNTQQTQSNTNNGNSNTQPSNTGSSVVEKGLFEKFNSVGTTIPTSVWVLANALLFLLIVVVLVYVFRRKH